MKLRLWGTRGSLPSAGPETVRYGGNSSCVEVRPRDGGLVVLDAGSGLRRLGEHVDEVERVDVLLTHLHLDHILGLGFFAPLYRPDVEVHLWGPSSSRYDLRARLHRYLNPPLFPVRLADLPSRVVLHDVSPGSFELLRMRVTADLVCHPGLCLGYRLSDEEGTMTYLPDHEPALGRAAFPTEREWTSGTDLSLQADLLIHDAQYTDEEYGAKAGWGHSTVSHAVAFARLVQARHLLAFHHDPGRSDDELARIWDVSHWSPPPEVRVTAAREGDTFTVP